MFHRNVSNHLSVYMVPQPTRSQFRAMEHSLGKALICSFAGCRLSHSFNYSQISKFFVLLNTVPLHNHPGSPWLRGSNKSFTFQGTYSFFGDEGVKSSVSSH